MGHCWFRRELSVLFCVCSFLFSSVSPAKHIYWSNEELQQFYIDYRRASTRNVLMNVDNFRQYRLQVHITRLVKCLWEARWWFRLDGCKFLIENPDEIGVDVSSCKSAVTQLIENHYLLYKHAAHPHFSLFFCISDALLSMHVRRFKLAPNDPEG